METEEIMLIDTLTPRAVVIISANIEWQALRSFFPAVTINNSPMGDWFHLELSLAGQPEPVLFFHGGWGKIAAAASTQYIIDRWSPRLLLNLATCGGFAGHIQRGEIVLAERTLVYDIIEQMTDPAEAIAHFATDIDLSWLAEPYPQPVRRTLLVSADRDLLAEEVPQLHARFGAVAGDWESGAIAWVAARHGTRCLILRGVTDLVDPAGGEAYAGNLPVFVNGTRQIFAAVLPHLPQWLERGLSGEIILRKV
jgi:adenosylhomocysteine nucleosidase